VWNSCDCCCCCIIIICCCEPIDERRDDDVECGDDRALPALKLPLAAKLDTLTLTRGVLRLDAATVRGLRVVAGPPPRRLALKSLVLFIYPRLQRGNGSGSGRQPSRTTNGEKDAEARTSNGGRRLAPPTVGSKR